MTGAWVHQAGGRAIAKASSMGGVAALRVRLRASHPAVVAQCNSEETKQYPAKKGSDRCKKKTPNSYKNDSNQDENTCENEKRREKGVGRSISDNRGM
jgi:hypothetical protein